MDGGDLGSRLGRWSRTGGGARKRGLCGLGEGRELRGAAVAFSCLEANTQFAASGGLCLFALAMFDAHKVFPSQICRLFYHEPGMSPSEQSARVPPASQQVPVSLISA